MLIVAAVAGASLVAGLLVWRLVLRPLQDMRRRMAREHARFETLALEDPVTRLPNNRAFEERLDAELRRAEREYYPVAVVVLELDAASAEAADDEALVRLSQHFEAELRAGDICARTGGSAFALALVRADAPCAERVLARIRGALGSLPEFSAGIAEFPRHAGAREDLLRRAGEALHRVEPGGAQSSQRRVEPPQQDSLLPTLHGLAREVDAKSRFTAGHSERVAAYAVAIARSFDMPEDRVGALRQAALLHDVGKVGIKESILTKEQALNLEEVEELKRHSELGRAMLVGAGFPELARWVYHLHERFDGDGYPFGITGSEIPLESRILHAADALDQMARPNAYRRHRPLREALAELSYCSGTRLDPEIAERLIHLVQTGVVKVAGHDDSTPRPRRALQPRRERPAC